jgi:hypothetical protein
MALLLLLKLLVRFIFHLGSRLGDWMIASKRSQCESGQLAQEEHREPGKTDRGGTKRSGSGGMKTSGSGGMNGYARSLRVFKSSREQKHSARLTLRV